MNGLISPPVEEPLTTPESEKNPSFIASEESDPQILFRNHHTPFVDNSSHKSREPLYYDKNKKDQFFDELEPYYRLQGAEDKTLVFESRFECGNLRRAV